MEYLDDLAPETLKLMTKLGVSYSKLKLSEIIAAGPDEKVTNDIQKAIDRANDNATCNAERIQKFALLSCDFSQATGEITPTLKLKREIVLKKNKNLIDKLYE